MSAARILIADTYYPEFLKSWDFNPAATYQTELKRLLEFSFGTADFYSRNLAALGWNATDVIANNHQLQRLWALTSGDIVVRDLARPCACQIEDFDPDVILFQDTSQIDWLFSKPPIVAAQVSCPWPGDDKVKKCDVIFTSFPHYIERIQSLGVRAVFNPLAFDPIVLLRVGDVPIDRPYPVTFVGGVGAPSHWLRGMEVLESVARAIPEFKWWGYGFENLPASSPLRNCYQGPAWGLDYYRILLQSKIVLNRHGTVAQGYSNNMRMFEATGCGAMLMTESSKNLRNYFFHSEVIDYASPDDAIDKIKYFLAHDDERQAIATRGQARTLADHTYANRMKVVSSTLQEMLCHA